MNNSDAIRALKVLENIAKAVKNAEPHTIAIRVGIDEARYLASLVTEAPPAEVHTLDESGYNCSCHARFSTRWEAAEHAGLPHGGPLAALTKPTPPASVSGEVVAVPRHPTPEAWLIREIRGDKASVMCGQMFKSEKTARAAALRLTNGWRLCQAFPVASCFNLATGEPSPERGVG